MVGEGSEQEERRVAELKAIEQIFGLMEKGALNEVFEGLIKPGPTTPACTRLVSELPAITAANLIWTQLLSWGLVSPDLLKNTKESAKYPFSFPGRQIHFYCRVGLEPLKKD